MGLLIFVQFIAIIFSTGPVHEDIIQWWNNLSVQRPVKCNLNPLYKQPLNTTGTLSNIMKPHKRMPVLFSQPCHYNDQFEQLFIYKGKKNYFTTTIQIVRKHCWTKLHASLLRPYLHFV